MIIVEIKESACPRQEVWFYNAEKIKDRVFNYYYYSLVKPTGKVDSLVRAKTLLVDLSKPSEWLFQALTPSYRYEIRRAEKEAVRDEFITSPGTSEFEDLVERYNAFASDRGISPLNVKMFERLFKAGGIALAKAHQKEVWILTHLYLCDASRARLLLSYHNLGFASKSLRGYASKFLHWRDMLRFKAAKYRYYDFGGIDFVNHPGISKFKLGFGGNVVENYSYARCLPPFGFLSRLKGQLSKIASARDE